MKTATINFKTDPATKLKARKAAEELGIPLSNLLNAYLHELASTGTVYFSITEPVTEKTEKVMAKIEQEIAEGELSEPFDNLDSLFRHLDNLS